MTPDRDRRIRTKPDLRSYKGRIGGWLSGKRTYLRIADEHDDCIAVVSGHRLYRLAKAIVRQFESGRP